MKFTAIIALLGVTAALRVNQKMTVSLKKGGKKGGEKKGRGPRDEDEGEESGSGSGSGSEWNPPTAAEIFAQCDSNADAALTIEEAVSCAAAEVQGHIQKRFESEWPTDAAGAYVSISEDDLAAFLASEEKENKGRGPRDQEESQDGEQKERIEPSDA